MSIGLIVFSLLYAFIACISILEHIDDAGYEKVYEIIGTRNDDKWKINDWVLVVWVSIFWPIPMLIWVFTGKRIIAIGRGLLNFFLFLIELIFFPFLFLFRFFKKNKNINKEPFKV